MSLKKTRPIKNKEIFSEIARDKCFLCGRTNCKISLHHIVPRSHIRLDIKENLVPLCEFDPNGYNGCHQLMKSPEWKFYTKKILDLSDEDRISTLRGLSPTWGFWLYWDDKK